MVKMTTTPVTANGFYAPTNYFFGQLRSVSMDNRGNLIIVENDLGYVRQIDFQRLSP